MLFLIFVLIVIWFIFIKVPLTNFENRAFTIGSLVFIGCSALGLGAHPPSWLIVAAKTSLITIVSVFVFYRMMMGSASYRLRLVAMFVSAMAILFALKEILSELSYGGMHQSDYFSHSSVVAVLYLFVSGFLLYRFVSFAGVLIVQRFHNHETLTFLFSLFENLIKWMGYATLITAGLIMLTGLTTREETFAYLLGLFALVLSSPPGFRYLFGLNSKADTAEYEKRVKLVWFFLIVGVVGGLLYLVETFSAASMSVLSVVIISLTLNLIDSRSQRYIVSIRLGEI